MRTEYTLQRLTTELQGNCGDMLAACQAVGVSLMFVNQWAKDDDKVREALVEAERVGGQGLISEAIRRAVHGVNEDVWFKGLAVGTKKVYSDSLLGKLLEAKVPEFNKKSDGQGVQVNVNVANLMPRAENYDQWLEMKASTLKSAREQVALPAPDNSNVIEAEFTPVPASLKDIHL